MSLDFDADPEATARWNTWVARGRAHETAVHRRFFITLPILAVLVAAYGAWMLL
jgi:hypothetical protein